MLRGRYLQREGVETDTKKWGNWRQLNETPLSTKERREYLVWNNSGGRRGGRPWPASPSREGPMPPHLWSDKGETSSWSLAIASADPVPPHAARPVASPNKFRCQNMTYLMTRPDQTGLTPVLLTYLARPDSRLGRHAAKDTPIIREGAEHSSKWDKFAPECTLTKLSARGHP